MKEQCSNTNSTIVDVRTPGEFAEKHVPGALNIPLDEIPNRVEEFKQMAKPIIAYCRSGNRSGVAASFLQQQGIDEIYNGGGLNDMMPSEQ